MTAWRLLDQGHAAPAWNMALDEALLESFGPGDAPILRLYGWRPAALSLGRFQDAAALAALPESLPRVRRVTGGGAIHHREDEVTYAIVAPYALFPGAGPKTAYRAVHGAIARGLAALGADLDRAEPTPEVCGRGPPLCYDRATDFDLRAGARKLVGSAQRRRGAAFLQHGSVPVSPDPFSPLAVSLCEVLGRPVAREDVGRAVRDGVALGLGVRLEPSAPTPREDALARELERTRYGQASWNVTAVYGS